MLYIFIVSLKQDIEKRATISKILNSFNLDFKFIDAVYGKELPDNYLDIIRNKSAGKLVDRGFPATPGEIGCTLSHLKAYQEVIDQGLEWACILEDDAILDDRFKTFVEGFQSDLLKPSNLYLLGGQVPRYENQIIKSYKNSKLVGGQKFYKTIKSEKFVCRTCCYLVSSSLAKNLIQLSKSKFILADDWAYLVGQNLIESIYLSHLVEHPVDLSGSNIEKEREAGIKSNKELSLKPTLRATLRHAMRWRLRVLILNTYRYIEKKDTD